MEEDLKEVKSMISSLLISSPVNLTIRKLIQDYFEIQDTPLPYEKFGFSDAESFLQSMHDILTIEGRGINAILRVIVTDKNKHIKKLVTEQRQPKRYAAPRFQTRYKLNRSSSLPRRAASACRIPPFLTPARPSVLYTSFRETSSQNSARNALYPTPTSSSRFPVGYNLPFCQNSLRKALLPTPTREPVLHTLYNGAPFQNSVRKQFFPTPSKELVPYTPRADTSFHNSFNKPPPPLIGPGSETYSRPPPPPLTSGRGRSFHPPYTKPVRNPENDRFGASGSINVSINEQCSIATNRERDNSGTQCSNGLNSTEINMSEDEIYMSDTEDEEEGVEISSISEEFVDIHTHNVPLAVRTNLKHLIASCSEEGIWCNQLDRLYSQMFGKSLNYQFYGYRSLLQMCKDLDDIFVCVRPDNKDFKLLDKQKAIVAEDVPNSDCRENSVAVRRPTQFAIPNAKELRVATQGVIYPTDIMLSSGQVMNQFLKGDQEEMDFIDVIVTEIYDPSKFWLILAEQKGGLDNLMRDLQEFYSQQESQKDLAIVLCLLEVGMLCCTRFHGGEFHRATVVDLMLDCDAEVKVFFFDYGTTARVPANSLFFLHKKFCEFPKQAIRARLANIYPPVQKTQWSTAASIRFLELSSNIQLVAQLQKINWEKQIVSINLADTTTAEDVYINDVLVEEGYAIFTSQEQDQRPADGQEPRVPYLHLHPSFEEIESGIVPTLNEMISMQQNNIDLTSAYPHYFITTTVNGEDDSDSVKDCSKPLTETVAWKCLQALVDDDESDDVSNSEPSAYVNNTNHSSGYFDTIGSVPLPNCFKKLPSDESKSRFQFETSSNRNVCDKTEKEVENSPYEKSDQLKHVISTLLYCSDDDDDEGVSSPSTVEECIDKTQKLSLNGHDERNSIDRIDCSVQPKVQIIRTDLDNETIHVIKLEEQSFVSVLEVVRCFSEQTLTIDRIRKVLMMRCAAVKIKCIDVHEYENLAVQLLSFDVLSEQDISRKKCLIYLTPVEYLPFLLYILNCDRKLAKFDTFLKTVDPNSQIWQRLL